MRERMSAGSDNLQSVFAHQTRNDTAQVCDIGSRFFYVVADSGAHFDHRLDHFRFDLLTEQHLALFQNFRDMRTQLAGVRINNLKLFLNTECELLEHASGNSLLSDGSSSLPSFPNGSELTVSCFSWVDYRSALVAPRLRPLFEHRLMRPLGEGALNGWCSPATFDRTIHGYSVIWLTL